MPGRKGIPNARKTEKVLTENLVAPLPVEKKAAFRKWCHAQNVSMTAIIETFVDNCLADNHLPTEETSPSAG